MKFDAIVIGAGPNGLTAAACLAKRGRKVLVLDAADGIGGHTRAIEIAPGFRAPLSPDAGWVPPTVASELGIRQFPAASSAMIVGSPDGETWKRCIGQLHRFAAILGEMYQRPAPDVEFPMSDVPGLLKLGLKVRGLGRHDMTEFLRVLPMSVQDWIDDNLKDEGLKTMVAVAAVRDLRQGPRSGATMFNLLHNMVGAAPTMLRRSEVSGASEHPFVTHAASAAKSRGATIETGARVARIRVGDTGVIGVALADGREIDAPVVLSTADPKRTLLQLVEPEWLDPEFARSVHNIRLHGSTAYVLYGVSESADIDSSFFELRGLTQSTTALERAADAAKYGEIAAEPHIEVTVARTDAAPDKHRVLAARIQYAPYSLKGGWTPQRATDLERAVTKAIGGVVKDFAALVRHKRVLTPVDVENEFGVTEGAFTHGEVMLDQILFMRPVAGWSRYSMPVRGLFLGGSGAHPGPGVLGGAGLLAAKAALKR